MDSDMSASSHLSVTSVLFHGMHLSKKISITAPEISNVASARVRVAASARGIWLQAFVHIDGGDEQLAFRGHLLSQLRGVRWVWQ